MPGAPPAPTSAPAGPFSHLGSPLPAAVAQRFVPSFRLLSQSASGVAHGSALAAAVPLEQLELALLSHGQRWALLTEPIPAAPASEMLPHKPNMWALVSML